jgi:uncharacterized protein (DUF1778 family)
MQRSIGKRVPRHPIQVRFGQTDYEFIATQASSVGESFSEFVRTAALARAWMSYARHNVGELASLDTVYEAAARLLGEETGRRRTDPPA